jgi:hypothetical protein
MNERVRSSKRGRVKCPTILPHPAVRLRRERPQRRSLYREVGIIWRKRLDSNELVLGF